MWLLHSGHEDLQKAIVFKISNKDIFSPSCVQYKIHHFTDIGPSGLDLLVPFGHNLGALLDTLLLPFRHQVFGCR